MTSKTLGSISGALFYTVQPFFGGSAGISGSARGSDNSLDDFELGVSLRGEIGKYLSIGNHFYAAPKLAWTSSAVGDDELAVGVAGTQIAVSLGFALIDLTASVELRSCERSPALSGAFLLGSLKALALFRTSVRALFQLCRDFWVFSKKGAKRCCPIGIMSTVSLTVLQQAMGHASLAVSLGYLRNLEVPMLNVEDMPRLQEDCSTKLRPST